MRPSNRRRPTPRHDRLKPQQHPPHLDPRATTSAAVRRSPSRTSTSTRWSAPSCASTSAPPASTRVTAPSGTSASGCCGTCWTSDLLRFRQEGRQAALTKTKQAVELATLEWVAWFNHHRLMEPLGYSPPAEFEANYHRHALLRARPSDLNQMAFAKRGAVQSDQVRSQAQDALRPI